MSPTITAEIITIGDEILFGQIIDTNTSWIGAQLTDIGIKPARKTSVGDDQKHILDALSKASQDVRIVIITGGLGPTKDDITKQTLCKFFGSELYMIPEALVFVTEYFAKRGRELTQLNSNQALLPTNATYIQNDWGTAPAMWFEENEVIYVSLPGVPFEMKNLMEHKILPLLQERFSQTNIIHKSLRTVGIGESYLAEKISAWESNLPAHIRLAYLPHHGQVKLRLTGTGHDLDRLENELDQQIQDVMPIIDPFVFGFGDDELENVIGQLLIENQATVSTAESCTGGFLASKITNVAGSSQYYEGSVISYSNSIKNKVLDVKIETLQKFGAVSEQTAIEMAEGVRKKLNTTFSLSTTGIAGPGGGTPNKPVGTVWIACAGPKGTVTKLLSLKSSRTINIEMTTTYALNLLRQTIIETEF